MYIYIHTYIYIYTNGKFSWIKKTKSNSKTSEYIADWVPSYKFETDMASVESFVQGWERDVTPAVWLGDSSLRARWTLRWCRTPAPRWAAPSWRSSRTLSAARPTATAVSPRTRSTTADFSSRCRSRRQINKLPHTPDPVKQTRIYLTTWPCFLNVKYGLISLS